MAEPELGVPIGLRERLVLHARRASMVEGLRMAASIARRKKRKRLSTSLHHRCAAHGDDAIRRTLVTNGDCFAVCSP
ncbi:MAG: hypothetical protein U1E62_26045 [Alsobacter sp.]